MAVIEKTFHSWDAIQKWIDQTRQQTEQPNIRILVEEPEDDFFTSLTPEQQQELEEGITRGMEDIEAGRFVVLDDNYIKGLKQRLRESVNNK